MYDELVRMGFIVARVWQIGREVYWSLPLTIYFQRVLVLVS
jgi:hypothetical protein